MPEENDPPQQPPEQSTLLGNLAPDEMFARGMQSVKMTSGTAGAWHPPSVEETAQLFPGYEVVRLLGRGGMGAVYQARQIELDRLVAIKLLPLEISVDKDFADRFRREARAMAKLNHPHIIAVYDFGTTREGHLYFVMEFVEGANLADIIHQVGLDGDQALSIVEQVCTALAYAHGKGIVHRDIKPANVMIDTESHVKVADFGLARLTDASTVDLGHTMTGTVMGTPDYMAPEQSKGMNVDHRADIYSVGVMLYEMLCREVPKGIFDPPSHRTACDARIDQIVIRAMQQAPDRRFQSTQEMRTAITSARLPVVIPEAEPVAPVSRPPPKSAAPAPPRKPAPPKPAVMKAIPPPGPKKSKLPLFGGIAAAIVVLAAGAFFFMPRAEKLTKAEVYAKEHGAAPMDAGMTAVAPSPAAGKTIALLPLIDVKRDVVKGTWSITPEGLSLDSSSGFGVCELPYEPAEEYDLEAEFTPKSSGFNVNLHVRAGASSCIWKLNAHGRTPPVYGIDLLDGKLMTSRTEALAGNPLRIETGKRFTTRFEVRKTGLRGLVDGHEIFTWSGDYKRLSTEEAAQLRNPRALGVGGYGRAVVFHRIEVREVTGAGKLTAGSGSIGVRHDASPAPSAVPTRTLPPSSEPWVDALADPAALVLKLNALRDSEGLHIRGPGDAILARLNGPDFAVRILSQRSKGFDARLRLRGSPGNNLYAVVFNPPATVTVQRYNGNVVTVLKEFKTPQPVQIGARYDLEARIVGSKITVAFLGTTLGSVEDSTWSSGGAAVFSPGDGDAIIRAVQYLDLSTPSRPSPSTGVSKAVATTTPTGETGFRPLFDGKTLAGWSGYDSAAASPTWRVQDGTIMVTGDRSWLVAKEVFGDFELRLDWKVGPNGNGGVFFHMAGGEGNRPLTAPEMQLCARDVKDAFQTGALYNVLPASQDASLPTGEWNTARLVVQGTRCEHWVNDQLVLSYDVQSEEWKKQWQVSKFSKDPRYAQATQGWLALQGWTGEIAYRNIRIRPLPGAPR